MNIISTTGALVVLTVSWGIHPVNHHTFFFRSASALSNNVLTFPNNMYSILFKQCKAVWILQTVSTVQGLTPCPAGNPSMGRGGDPQPAPHFGEGGVPRPAPPRKNDQNRGGKIKARISTFSNRGNQWWNNITTLSNAQSSLSIGYARESKKWKVLLIFC